MSNKLPETSGSDEIDLGQLFKLTGNAFDRLFTFLGGLLMKLFLGLVWFMFFLKKHFLKIVIAGVIGFGVAVIQREITGPVYNSAVTVRQNYAIGKNLYDLVQYYNSLSHQRDSLGLGKALGLETSEAANILGFSVEPVVNENSRIQSYDTYIKTIDSILASDIDYDTYIENTMEHDYPYQILYIETKQARDLLEVFNNMVGNINSTEFYKNLQKKDIEELSNKELAIRQSLVASDSLKNTYKRVLEKTLDQDKVKASQTSVTIEAADQQSATKEFQLFQNDLLLRRELVTLNRSKQDKQDIVEIVSSEFTNGIADDTIEVFGKDIGKKLLYPFLFAALTFILLIGFEMNKFLEGYKDKI